MAKRRNRVAWGPMADYFRVRMPRQPGSYIPMGAIYHYAAPFTSDQPLRPILLFWEEAYWEEGQILWSHDPVRGGPPYWRGRAAEDQVPKLLDTLEAHGAFNSAVRNWARFPHNASHFDIAIAAGPRRLHLASHDRVPVPREQGEDGPDLQFCRLWSELDSALMSLRPDKGYYLGNVEFKVDWLP